VGGRHQGVALAAAVALEEWPHAAIATFATDGEDGPTNAAGAIVTGKTAELARTHNLEPIAFLNDNDSHTFFKQVEENIRGILDRGPSYGQCLIQTGTTGTNVNDLLFILAYPPPV
jgi:hydroxypyruvate reductase